MDRTPFSRGSNRLIRCVRFPIYVYAGWLGMMWAHELGHVLHAWGSGGRVSAVRVPLVGFSITELSANPHPHLVAWGGVVWGAILPTGLLLIVRSAFVQFFAGLCLVANGVYLAAGWAVRAGDGADLRKYGTPVWVMVVVGAAMTGAGLYLWHRMGISTPDRPSPSPSPLSPGERASGG